MKLNWGTGITIAIILFMGYILLMVFKATSTTQHLQAEDYYSQELIYQEKINALRLGNQVLQLALSASDASIKLKLPEGFRADDNLIKLEFLRPNDSALDLEFSVEVSHPEFNSTELLSGIYKVTVFWVENGSEHAQEFDYKHEKWS